VTDIPLSQGITLRKLTAVPEPTEIKTGRRKKIKFPQLPPEVLDAMSPVEREHFDFFLEAHREQYPDLTAVDQIGLNMAALCYVNLLRMEATQLTSGQLVSMARQHPCVQLRQWMDSLSVTRKQRPSKKDEDAETVEFLKSLSAR
jgi:hypothetical protein